MKICFFSDARNVHVQRLSAGLAVRGHTVQLVCYKPLDIPGVTVERFLVPRASLSMPYRWHTRWDRYLRSFMRRFDVVILYFLHDFGFTPEIIDDGCFIATPRGSDIVLPPGETPPSQELIERRIALLQSASMVGAACPRFAAVVAEFAGLSLDRIESLPLGVDLNKFDSRATKPRSHGATKENSVGFFKGFRAVYGAIHLVRAMPHVLAELPHTRFDLVGDGPQLAECRALAEELAVDSAVSWMPRQPHGQMPGLLRQWDVTAMPSICESFGLAALESSAMGVPVVAFNVGGLPDTVQHLRSGLLVPPESPKELADAIVSLMQDTTRRRVMGAFGREWVAGHYEWQQVLGQWETVFARARDRVGMYA